MVTILVKEVIEIPTKMSHLFESMLGVEWSGGRVRASEDESKGDSWEDEIEQVEDSDSATDEQFQSCYHLTLDPTMTSSQRWNRRQDSMSED